MKTRVILHELQRIHDGNGILRPEDVVSAAAHAANPLHGCFEWDDTKAAYLHRLQCARHLILASVMTLPNVKTSIRAFVSLKSDREMPGGGYRAMLSVLSHEEHRAQMLSDALDELKYFRAKYRMLNELAPVFAAMSSVERRQLKRLIAAS